MRAQAHPRESDRLAALHRYGILDTPREQDFDDIVQLASRLCDAPISVINLVDAERQWFKAEVGLGVRETPLETSLCAHAILAEDFVQIPDTLADPRMRDNPLCAGAPGLRFYAGAQLRTASGLPLGTLCVLDSAPRELTPLQVETLRVLAAQVMKQLELRRAVQVQDRLRHEANHRIKNSLMSMAAMIRLQARASAHDDTRAALGVVQQRVAAMGALHELLYKADSDGEIDLGVYMDHVSELLAQSAPAPVTLSARFEPVQVDAGRAAALAMIVNEFWANALKYAFPGGGAGRIDIQGEALLGDAGPPEYQLTFADDGVGVAGDALPQRAGGIGMGIVAASVQNLGGTLERVAGARGLVWRLRFPV